MLNKLKLLIAMRDKNPAMAIAEINSADAASLSFFFKENSYASDEYTPLHYAVKCLLPEVVDALLKKGMDPKIKSRSELRNASHETPLHTAIREFIHAINSKKEKRLMLRIIKRILEQDPSTRLEFNGNQSTPTHSAASHDNALPVLKLFLHSDFPKLDINLMDGSGSTLLRQAVFCYSVKTINFLLAKDANPRLYNHSGQLAIDLVHEGTEIHNILKPYHEKPRSLQTLCLYQIHNDKLSTYALPAALTRALKRVSLEIQNNEEEIQRQRNTL